MATEDEEINHVLSDILKLEDKSPLELFIEQHGFTSIALLLASSDSVFIDAPYTDNNGIETTLPRGYMLHIQSLRALRNHYIDEHEPIDDWTKVTKAEYDHFLRHTHVPTKQQDRSSNDETHVPYYPTGSTPYGQRGIYQSNYCTSWPSSDIPPVTNMQVNATETETPETVTTPRDLQSEKKKDKKKAPSITQPKEQGNVLTMTNDHATDIDASSTKQPSSATPDVTKTPTSHPAKTTSRSMSKNNAKMRELSTQKMQAMKTVIYHETQAAKRLQDYTKLTAPLES